MPEPGTMLPPSSTDERMFFGRSLDVAMLDANVSQPPPSESPDSAPSDGMLSHTAGAEEPRASETGSELEASKLPASAQAETSSGAVTPVSSELSAPDHTPAVPAAANVSRRRRIVLLPVVCALAILAGGALAMKIDGRGRAARITNLSGEVNSVQAEQDKTRAELQKQSASLAATREALREVAQRQTDEEAATTATLTRVEGEQVRLAREIAATKRAQSRTDEQVYQLSEALKLIDWATTGGNASEAIKKATVPRAPIASR